MLSAPDRARLLRISAVSSVDNPRRTRADAAAMKAQRSAVAVGNEAAGFG